MTGGWYQHVEEARKGREVEGNAKYGIIRPKSDRRCFLRELYMEVLDALNYARWSFEKGEISKKRLTWINSNLYRTADIIRFACEDRFDWRLRIYGTLE